MPKSAVFIVPNNQSQEFMVTRARSNCDPDSVYAIIENYDTEAKARAICKLGEIETIAYPFDRLKKVPNGLEPKKVKFHVASGYRTLLNRPEYSDCDYFYYFTKGRWLWTDSVYTLYEFIKEGYLSMCDGFLDKIKADAIKLIGNPDTLEKRGNEEAIEAYEALKDPVAFRDWFHYALGNYIDYFQKTKLKYFYKPWIDKNEKGVAAIVRDNILGELKRGKKPKQVLEATNPREREFASVYELAN